MTKLITTGAAILFAMTSGAALALDTAEPFLCAVADVWECVDGGKCIEVLPEEVDAPPFLRINVPKKEVIVTSERPASTIEHMEEIEGRLVLQGIEDGREDRPDGAGWTISIQKDTARMVVTGAINQAAIVLFGACTEL
jgi:hypothetical protein